LRIVHTEAELLEALRSPDVFLIERNPPGRASGGFLDGEKLGGYNHRHVVGVRHCNRFFRYREVSLNGTQSRQATLQTQGPSDQSRPDHDGHSLEHQGLQVEAGLRQDPRSRLQPKPQTRLRSFGLWIRSALRLSTSMKRWDGRRRSGWRARAEMEALPASDLRESTSLRYGGEPFKEGGQSCASRG